MTQESQFQLLLERLGRSPEDPVTIAYQSSKQRFTSKTIKVSLADNVVSALDQLDNNVWFEINPSNVSGRATAKDIVGLSAVYIDIDYKDTGAGSVKAGRELVDMLSSLIGVPPSAVVYSGHGIQPYWVIDAEEDFDLALAQGVLNRWGAFARFIAGSMDIQLDSVFDIPRIFRAPGSRNLKDPENPVPVVMSLPEQWRPVSLDELNDVLIAHGITSEMNMPEDFEQISSSKEWQYAPNDCHFASILYAGVKPTNGPPKSRHGWLLQQLVLVNAAHRNGCLTEATAHDLVKQIVDRFKSFLQAGQRRDPNPGELSGANHWAVSRVESFSEDKLNQELRGHLHTDFYLGDPSSVLGEPSANIDHSVEELHDIYNKSYGTYGRTDAANARRLVYYAAGNFKYIPDVGWYRWENGRYVFDKEKSIMQTAIEAAAFVEHTNASQDQIKWAQASANKDRITNAITLAGTDPEVLVKAVELDAQPNDLCTPAGIINLQTGEIREAIKAVDLNTRQTVVAPKEIGTPLWQNFLKEVLQDDERVAYLQELLGASLFGDSRYHVLPVLAGSGANGKSTLLDVVCGILGDYAATMPENFLLDTGNGAHPTEIARLRGVRFAMASETRPDGKFNESRVKMLTGGDMLSARFMNQNFFDFKPTHTLFLAVNHLPAVKSGGDGFWRRLRKMDFKVTIPKNKQRENFAQTMIEQEGSGILKWIVDGAVRVTNQGFNEPESVRLATLEYRHEEDHIAKFIDESIVLAVDGTVTKTALFNSYRNWCESNGEKPISQNAFNREIRSRLNAPETELSGIRMFSGIKLFTNEPVRLVQDVLGGREIDEYWR